MLSALDQILKDYHDQQAKRKEEEPVYPLITRISRFQNRFYKQNLTQKKFSNIPYF